MIENVLNFKSRFCRFGAGIDDREGGREGGTQGAREGEREGGMEGKGRGMEGEWREKGRDGGKDQAREGRSHAPLSSPTSPTRCRRQAAQCRR